MRVVVSGGGTGGHIMPALAVADSLRRLQPDTELLYIGGSSGMETEIVPERGMPFQAVTARKLRKTLSFSTLGVVLSLVRGYWEARAFLRAFGAQSVVGTGGYAAGATVLAAAHLGIPTVILEGNAVVGRTNRVLARYARYICVVFPETVPQFPEGKTVITGLPLRAGILAPPELTPQKARCRFPGLSPFPFTILVLGGSQGARAINALVLDALPALLQSNVQVLHQTGAKNFEEVQTQVRAQNQEEPAGYLPIAFLKEEQMTLALRAADVIVCRGGISTLSEATANGLPLLIIPLPSAYADHQTANARALERAGAALVQPENGLTALRLTADLLRLRDDPARREQMAAASLALGRPGAADTVAKLVLAV